MTSCFLFFFIRMTSLFKNVVTCNNTVIRECVCCWRNSPGHVQKERILHHQPAPRPAEAELMVSDTVEPQDAVTPRSFHNISLSVEKPKNNTKLQKYINRTIKYY